MKMFGLFFPLTKRVDYQGKNVDTGKKKVYCINLKFKQIVIHNAFKKFNTFINSHFATDNFKVWIISSVIANGNHVMNDLIFKNTWKFTYRGKCIPLDNLFISYKYGGTVSNLESVILFCV